MVVNGGEDDDVEVGVFIVVVGGGVGEGDDVGWLGGGDGRR